MMDRFLRRMMRCPICGNPDMVALGMTYSFPSRCEAMYVCPDDSCEGSIYAEMADPSMVATFRNGSYALVRAGGDPDGPILCLEGRGSSVLFRCTGGAMTSVRSGDVPEDVYNDAAAEAERWFARRLPDGDPNILLREADA